MGKPRLICLVGAECTGKTALAQALAEHYSGLVVPEYLRLFCEARGRTPTEFEQLLILREQLALQAQVLAQRRGQGGRYVFCDTSALQTAVYSEHYFADRSLYAQALAEQQAYDLTLLLAADLPWQADGMQRDGCQAQATVQRLLEQALTKVQPVVTIDGVGTARVLAAIEAVNRFAHIGLP
ncbi:MAG: ATP-binding protein [Comamonadaceae bacterium]|nr:ATP-binding protein [Comamonadaceae bacterium]